MLLKQFLHNVVSILWWNISKTMYRMIFSSRTEKTSLTLKIKTLMFGWESEVALCTIVMEDFCIFLVHHIFPSTFFKRQTSHRKAHPTHPAISFWAVSLTYKQYFFPTNFRNNRISYCLSLIKQCEFLFTNNIGNVKKLSL